MFSHMSRMLHTRGHIKCPEGELDRLRAHEALMANTHRHGLYTLAARATARDDLAMAPNKGAAFQCCPKGPAMVTQSMLCDSSERLGTTGFPSSCNR